MIDRRKYEKNLELLKKKKLNTVCIEANCPNRYECFSNNIATFLILGEKCTRSCKYCNIKSELPNPGIDAGEIDRIIECVTELKLDYVVITSVTRDDLLDHGADHFVSVIAALKKLGCQVEVLIPDFAYDAEALKKVVLAKPDVLNHNIEVVKNLYDGIRSGGIYEESLNLLSDVKKIDPDMIVKSGLMVGFGEEMSDILSTLKDLREHQVDIVTVGQYLSPSSDHHPVVKKYSDEEFVFIKKEALKLGFSKVESGKYVRSSYHAKETSEFGI